MPNNLKWNDIIQVTPYKAQGEQESMELKNALEEWLCFLEKTKFGQELLQHIQDKGKEKGFINQKGQVEKLEVLAVPNTGGGSQFFYFPTEIDESTLTRYKNIFPKNIDEKLGSKQIRFVAIDGFSLENEGIYYLDENNEKQKYDIDLFAHELAHAAGYYNSYELLEKIYQGENKNHKEELEKMEEQTTQLINDELRIPILNKPIRAQYYQNLELTFDKDPKQKLNTCHELTLKHLKP